MQKLHTPAPEHLHFDAICADVDDFEPLPTKTAAPQQEPDHEDETLDGLILAGLVAPF